VKKRTKTRPISTPLLLKTKPDATKIAPVPEGTIQPSVADETQGIANALTVTPGLSPQQPGASPTVSADQVKPNADKPDSIAENYLEVGSFKDTKWADDAVERLSQQGFHAICVHKTVLWMQSYHVEVGPYATSGEIDDAQNKLSEQGIKSHIVK
jgi:cell division protein FtsN